MTTTRTVPYRRRREDKTNYKKRMSLLLGKKPRLVVRKSLKNMIVQLIEYDAKGDKVLASAHSKELKKMGWQFGCGNLPSAYLTGLLLGKKALAKKQKEAIVDFGLQSIVPGSRMYAAVKGAVDAGMQIPHDAAVFPSEERIKGEHIAKNPLEKTGKGKEMPPAFAQWKEKIAKG